MLHYHFTQVNVNCSDAESVLPIPHLTEDYGSAIHQVFDYTKASRSADKDEGESNAELPSSSIFVLTRSPNRTDMIDLPNKQRF